MDFPTEHWKQVSSTNPLERLNKEINRRTRWWGSSPMTRASSDSSVPSFASRTTSGCRPRLHEQALAGSHLPGKHHRDRRRGHPRRCYSDSLETKLEDLREHAWVLHTRRGRYHQFGIRNERRSTIRTRNSVLVGEGVRCNYEGFQVKCHLELQSRGTCLEALRSI